MNYCSNKISDDDYLLLFLNQLKSYKIQNTHTFEFGTLLMGDVVHFALCFSLSSLFSSLLLVSGIKDQTHHDVLLNGIHAHLALLMVNN